MKGLTKSIKASLIVLGAVGLSATACSAQPAAISGQKPCQVARPAIARTVPAHWLGGCSQGRGEGIGVLRIGTGEPFEFFFGEVHAGRPVRGMIKTANGWYPAAGFDARMAVVNPRSWNPQQAHEVYVLAIKATQATARRFTKTGNKGSARYYERLAQQIADGEPE